MAESICLIAAYVWTMNCEQWTYWAMYWVFKDSYKGNSVTFYEVTLVFLLLNLKMFVTWIWFSVAEESLDSLICRQSQIHWRPKFGSFES